MTTLSTNTIEKTHMPEHWPAELRAVLWLGIPMALTQLAQFSIYTVDTVMIGRISAEDLAAAALGTVIYFLLWMIGNGPVMAVTPLISHALGANQNDIHDARVSVRMALWVVALMFPVLMMVILMAEPMALALGQDPVVSKKAAAYVLALAPGWPFALGTMVLRNFLASIGKTLMPFVLVMSATLINVGLNYTLIFGHFGLPALGLVGAGIASSLSYALGFAFFVIYIVRDKKARTYHVFEHFWRPHWQRFREIMSLGWPISMATVFEGMLFNAAILIVGFIGVYEQAAYQIALNVAVLAFMLPFGLSMAGSVRIGLATGAGNLASVRRVSLVTLAVGVASILLVAIPVALSPHMIASLYLDMDDTANIAVVALVSSFLPIAAAFMVFDAAQVAANQLLRGLKDVRWSMVMTGVSYWCVGFPVAMYLGLRTELSAQGVWYGLLAGLVMACITLCGRLWWLLRSHRDDNFTQRLP